MLNQAYENHSNFMATSTEIWSELQDFTKYLEPVMRDIEAMLQESQRNVNGTAILELRPLSFSTVGVESKDDLVKTKFGEYGEMQKGWTAEDAKGFIKVTSTPLRVYYNNHKDEEI